jgi:hypothetical protein
MPNIPAILLTSFIEKRELGSDNIDKNGIKEMIEKASKNPFIITITIKNLS